MVCAGPLVSSTPLQRPCVRLFVSPPLQETHRGIYPRRVCPGRVKCRIWAAVNISTSVPHTEDRGILVRRMYFQTGSRPMDCWITEPGPALAIASVMTALTIRWSSSSPDIRQTDASIILVKPFGPSVRECIINKEINR